MVCFGLEPGAAGLKMQTNPLCYGGTLEPFLCRARGVGVMNVFNLIFQAVDRFIDTSTLTLEMY